MKAMMKQMNQRLAKLEKENTQLKSQVQKSKTSTVAKTTTPKQKKTIAVAKTEATNEETQAHVEKFAEATVVKSKVPVLEFSGKHYLGFVSSEVTVMTEQTDLKPEETICQLKGIFGENLKDYFRITLDTFQNTEDDGDGG